MQLPGQRANLQFVLKNTAGTLQKYLPEGSLELTLELLRTEPIELKISRPRKTKFGDYRFPKPGSNRHRISVNANLNPYAFLITLIHEVAHLKAFKDHGKGIKPHGVEWQKTFLDLCLRFFEQKVFPADLQEKLQHSLHRGAASSCTDLNLYRALKQHDEPEDGVVTLEQLPDGTAFQIGSKLFKKGPRSRKRFRCRNLQNGREYMVHPLAEVKLHENSKDQKSA